MKIPGLDAVAPAYEKIMSSTQDVLASAPSRIMDSIDIRDPVGSAKAAVKLFGDDLIQNTKNKIDAAGKDIFNAAKKDILKGILGDDAPNLDTLKQQHEGLIEDAATREFENTPSDSWYAQARARPDPLLAIDWDVDMPNINGFRLPASYVEEVQLNLPNLTELNVFRNGTQEYFAGFSDVGTLSITCYEDRFLTATHYFAEWHKLIQNPDDGTFNPPAKYWKTLTFYVTAPIGGGQRGFKKVGKFVALGCFPKDRQGLNFQSQSSDRQHIQCTFSVNQVIYIPMETAGVSAASHSKVSSSATPIAEKAKGLLGEPTKLLQKLGGGGMNWPDGVEPQVLYNPFMVTTDRMFAAAGISKDPLDKAINDVIKARSPIPITFKI